MLIRKQYIIIFCLSLILVLVIQPLIAQQGKEMLMFQVDGNNYIKKNYDKNAKLLDYQIIKIGKISKNGNENIMSVRLYNYNKSGNLIDSSWTKYICNPKDSLLLMNIFPFAFLSATKTVNLKAKGKSNLYPSQWEIGEKIPDVTFSAKMSGGALSAFGSSGEVKIYDRSITSHDKSTDLYLINSKIRIIVYAYGIRLKTIDYTIDESVNQKNGIIKQKFKEISGEYFTITLNNN